MFHEVKIFDKKGKIKKVLSGKKLSRNYWNFFFNNSFSDSIKKGKAKNRKPPKNVDFDDESAEFSID